MNLPRIRTFSSSSRENPVFDILRSNFDLLLPSEQSLFMDVGLFEHHGRDAIFENLRTDTTTISSIQCLCNLHKEDEVGMMRRLENLKRKGLLQDVDLRTREIKMHDLYYEFAELEAKGSFNELGDLENRMWVYVDNGNLTELEKTPGGRCWPKLVRLTIAQDSLVAKQECQIVGGIANLEGIQWGNFCNVEVFHLEGLNWGRGTFNLECLIALRVLYLFEIDDLGSLEGLGKLKNVTQFTWTHTFTWTSVREDIVTPIVGQLPLSLKALCINGHNVVFGADLFAQCYNLSKLDLAWVEVSTLDLSNCRSLKSVCLLEISKLQTVSGFSTYQASTLQSLHVEECEDLVDIPGMNHLINLKELSIESCFKFEFQRLFAISKVPHLELRLGREVQSLVVGV